MLININKIAWSSSSVRWSNGWRKAHCIFKTQSFSHCFVFFHVSNRSGRGKLLCILAWQFAQSSQSWPSLLQCLPLAVVSGCKSRLSLTTLWGRRERRQPLMPALFLTVLPPTTAAYSYSRMEITAEGQGVISLAAEALLIGHTRASQEAFGLRKSFGWKKISRWRH